MILHPLFTPTFDQGKTPPVVSVPEMIVGYTIESRHPLRLSSTALVSCVVDRKLPLFRELDYAAQENGA